MELWASCAFGLEAVVARELKALGAEDVRSDNGSVRFCGDEATLCRANLWLRTADRVFLRMGEFPASTFEELFEGTRALDWGDFLPSRAEFPVTGSSAHSQLTSVPACQGVVKKAVVESMKAVHRLEWFPEDGPAYPIRFSLVRNQCVLSVDTSGSGLHRRGYRLHNVRAPLRETVAAGLVLLSYWNKNRLLVDPMCGSGTILLEAALIGTDRAPGLRRDFVSEAWAGFPWKKVRREAEQRFDRTAQLDILGSDVDPDALRNARRHLAEAGLEDRGIRFQKRPVEEFRSRHAYGVLITNPPYGERLSERALVEPLYRTMGGVFEPLLETWSVYVLTSHPEFEKHFGREAARRRKLYNGLIPCTYYQYPGPRPPEERPS